MFLLRPNLLCLLAAFVPLASAPAQSQPASPPQSWTDWADLALVSPVVIRASVNRVDRLSRREAPDVPPEEVRVLVRADLLAALKSPSVLPAEAAWRWQGPADARGRPPFGRKADVLVFARPLSGGSDPAVQPLALSSRSAQQPWSAEAEAIVRDVLTQALKPGATGLMVIGVRDAFHTEGDVAGASESQFFLRTEGGAPLTLVVTRSPDAREAVAVATGDLVEMARPVQPRTLLWRGLACGMPDHLPAAFAASPALAADWALAKRRIGACGRTPG
jgi:hypothetical protein